MFFWLFFSTDFYIKRVIDRTVIQLGLQIIVSEFYSDWVLYIFGLQPN